MSTKDYRAQVVPADRRPVIELLDQRYDIQIGEAVEEEGERVPQSGDLDYRSIQVLISINEDPCLTQTQRMRELGHGWDGRKMNHRKEKLQTWGLIEERAVQTGSGAEAHYHLLTEAGREMVKQLGERPNTLHGSLEHHCLIVELARQYEDTYKTHIDKEWKGYRPDILCKGRKHEETGIVEVMQTMHTKTDLQKLHELSERADWVHVYCVKESDRQHLSAKITELFSEAVSAKVEVRTAGQAFTQP